MKHLALATLGPFLILPIPTRAQVKVSVPVRRYEVQEKIYAKVENVGRDAVTLCLEAGQTSPLADGLEATSTPFWVQVHSNDKWSTLLIGPDVSSSKAPLGLAAGEAQEFSFRLSDYGEMRLRLKYWRGSKPDLNCKAPPKSPKVVTSHVFTINYPLPSYHSSRSGGSTSQTPLPKTLVDDSRYTRVTMGMGRIEGRTSALGGYEGPNGEQISTMVADFGIIAGAKGAHQHVDHSAAEIVQQGDILDESGKVIGYRSVLTLVDQGGKKSSAVVITKGGDFREYKSPSLWDVLAFDNYMKSLETGHAN
jgi:hypothetical protein